MTIDDDRDPAAGLVDPHGRPMRRRTGACPQCGADPSSRVASAGFGRPHDVCGRCGYEFTELTVTPERRTT